MDAGLITRYFPEITSAQQEQYAKLAELYGHWNQQINVISRKDTDSLYERHVLHSLGIAKVMPFLPGEQVLDVGTGGGFRVFRWLLCSRKPVFIWLIALAKNKVVQEVAGALGLQM